MKNLLHPKKLVALLFLAINTSFFAQTNVFDDIISSSANHTYLTAALVQENLDAALQDPNANLTVFAPDDNAFLDLANALNTDINGLLALPNLSDILLYHVLGSNAPSSALTNGQIVTPLNPANTIKLTVTTTAMVYANQAMVNAADLTASNGVVHSTNAVLLPNETVVDVAIDNGFNNLATAVIKAELLPVLTDPLGTFTVFAPTDQAFVDLATALNTDVNGLLALPNLADILTYHVIGSDVASSTVSNGLIKQPVSSTNTLKFTVNGDVFVNQAKITSFDVVADNGRVHIIDAVVLPSQTVVDVAINNGFTSLVAAVIEAKLTPALSNPTQQFTVFAPTNQAFDDLALALGTDINGVLANPLLADILLYHAVSGAVYSTDLTSGPVPTLQGDNISVDLSMGVMINNSNVVTADVPADNGVVHIIDEVLLPSVLSVSDEETINVALYPNPTSEFVTVNHNMNDLNTIKVLSANGSLVDNYSIFSKNVTISLDQYNSGLYYFVFEANNKRVVKTLNIIK